MFEEINLDNISLNYDGNNISTVPNTYKAFLELLRDKAGLTNNEFIKRTIWRGDFPILCKKDYIKAIRMCNDKKIMRIDLITNEYHARGKYQVDYMDFLESKEQEEIIKLNIDEEENKEETIYIKSKSKSSSKTTRRNT